MTTSGLLDIRDELAEARAFLACVELAASSYRVGAAERSALCAVGSAALDKLDTVMAMLDQLLQDSAPSEVDDGA